jgi:hypothetical protein
MTHDQPIVNRRIFFQFNPASAANDCNDAIESSYFLRSPEAVSVISADQKGSIWSVGCTVSLEDGTTSVEITKILGRATLVASNTSDHWVNFSKQTLDPPIEIVDGQYISATVVYSFN